MYLVCDSYGTHRTLAVRTWLGTHPSFHAPRHPTGSASIIQVQRWFGPAHRIRRRVLVATGIVGIALIASSNKNLS